VRHLAVAALALTAACSSLRGGPDLSQGGLELVFRVAARPEHSGKENALAQATARTIDARLREAGCRSEVVASASQVRVRIPGKCADYHRLKQLMRRRGQLEFREVDEGGALVAIAARLTPGAAVKLEVFTGGIPRGGTRQTRYLEGPLEALTELRAALPPNAVPKELEALIEPARAPDEQAVLRLVKREVVLSGSAVRKAEVITDPQTNRPELAITFDAVGAEAFARLTKQLVGRQLAIVIDGTINSAPVIMSEITGGKVRITFGYGDPKAQRAEARDLAIVLQSGALPELDFLSEDQFPQPPPQELKLAVEGQQLVLRLSSGGLWRLGNPPTPAELEPVITTARAASRRPRVELLIRGAYDVPEPARNAVFKAVADAKIESVACLKDNRNCR